MVVTLLALLLGLLLASGARASLAPDGLLTGESGEARFGQAVALSGDGSTAVVGAPNAAGEAGAVWVFTRTASGWAQQAVLTAKSGEEIGHGQFGASVAVSANGNTVLIGAPADAGAGAVWAFKRTGTTWVQQGEKLTGAEVSANDEFGRSVALSAKGETAVVGAPGDGGEAGAIWAFTRSEGAEEAWSQQGPKLTPEPGEEVGGARFGASVALSAEGEAVVVGAPADGANQGAAWVLTRIGSVWAQQGPKLTGSEELEEGRFGTSVALGAEAETALIGGPGDNHETGAAWAFTRSGSIWTQQAKFTAAGAVSGSAFGTSVALSATGNTALVGGPGETEEVGAAWIFTRSEGAFTQQGTSLTGAEEIGKGRFAAAVALSADAAGVLVGGPVEGESTGAAWAFADPPTVLTTPASSLTQTSATLNATVNPNGGTVTDCHFEYGTSTSYGESVPCAALPESGTTPQAVSAPVTGLVPNTKYYVRIAATDGGGTSTDSVGQTFKTLPEPPTALSRAATSLSQSSATLNATVNPNGDQVSSCSFEYGPTESYGSSVSCTPSPGSGSSPVVVSATAQGLAANTTYHFRVVATNAGGTSEGSDGTFKTLPDAPAVVTGAASAVAQTAATLSATVNPNGGEVSECEFEYGSTVSYGASVPCKPSPGSGGSAVEVSAPLNGLSANSTYHFRIVAANAGGTRDGSDQTFKTLPDAPTALTGAATALTQTSATLNATVNPNGGKVSKCFFEYGEGTSYGSTAPCAALPGAGSSPVAVSADVTGLSPNATYHFRVVATNAGGTSEGSDQTFKTLPDAPAVVTGAVSAVTQSGATLNATVDPNGGEVSECEFEYGSTVSYGASVPCKPSPGSGGSAVEVSAAITGLNPNSTYHFRVVATNAGGTREGSDQTFKTLPDAPVVATGEASAVTQTSATLNATVNPKGGAVSACKLEYGSSTSYGSSVSCTPSPGSGSSPVVVSATAKGLSANTTYHFRVVATNAGGTSEGSDQTFKTLPDAPAVVTGAASAVTQTTATLSATVNPNGGEVSECEFEYGPTVSYGASVPCKPSPGAGGSAVEVSAALKGLSANSTYHFRVLARNAGGTSEGSDQTFKTLPNAPAVVTGAASAVAQTTATLSATVNPNGGAVSGCKLEYGTSTSYGSSASCTPPPGAGSSPVAVSSAVTGLAANTTYHFRVVATNAGGTSEGSDQTFKTLPNAPAVVTGSSSAVAQTTVTLNATVNPNGATVSGCYFEYGEGTSYGSKVACSALPGSGTSAVAVSAALAGLVKNTTYHFRIVSTNAGGTSTGLDQTVETAPGPPTIIAGETSSIGQTSAVMNAEINPNGGVVEQCYFHYEGMSSGSQVVVVPCVGLPLTGKNPAKVSALAEGLSASTIYTVSLEVINSFGEVAFGEDASFETAPGPSVITTPASSITQTSAILNGTVDPNGGEVTYCHFEYGPTESYGEQVPCASLPGSGTSAVPVSAALPGLSADTPYYFRIVAITAGGESKDTRGQSFQTLPEIPMVATGSASSITQTTASLGATVNPNGGAVSACKLEYGTSIAYGENVPCSSPPGSGKSPVPVSAALAGLGADTTYHFRIVAANAGGIGLPGADQTFTTLPDAPTVVTANASSISQTAAILSAVVDPNGGPVSACKLEYGTSTSYGSSVSCLPSVEPGSSDVTISAAVLGLNANTTYHFRVVAINVGGTGSSGDESFTTAPVPTLTSMTGSTDTSSSSTTTTDSPKTSCKVSLVSTSAMVKRGGAVAIKLVSAAADGGICSGRLTLAINTKGRGKRAKSTPIGTAAFSLTPGKTALVMVKLDRAGRLLLEADHGRLSASLTVLESAPVPSQALSAIVRVVREKPAR